MNIINSSRMNNIKNSQVAREMSGVEESSENEIRQPQSIYLNTENQEQFHPQGANENVFPADAEDFQTVQLEF